MTHESTLQQFISQHVARVEPMIRKAALANWEMQITSSEEAKNRATELIAQLVKSYANAEEFALLKSLPAESIQAPLLARQHKLLHNAYLASQMEPAIIEEIVGLEVEIEDTFNTHRATVQGNPVSDNEMEDTLQNSQDVVLRRETWEASKTVGAVIEERVRRLVLLRNREARKLGFDNYYSMQLTLQEIEEERLFALLDDLYRQSKPLWTAYRNDLDAQLATRFQTTPDAIRPWHHANSFFQASEPGEVNLDPLFADKDLEAITAEFFTTIGLPIDDLLQIADLYERPGKCQHAFCLSIDKEGDVRVLCNNRPNERWMSTMLHEFGHAVYDKFCDPNLPYLLREPAHTMTTEAIALFMGRLTKDPVWLCRYAGVAPEAAEPIGKAAQRELRDSLLVFMHWCFVMANFERALYRDPNQDLTALWWEMVEKYQKVVCPPEDRPPHSWAAKIHLATSPVYYHNYLLGEMLASQLLHYIQKTVLAGEGAEALISSPKVGEYMRESLFYPGALRPWEEWLENATGEPLRPSYFAAQLT